MQETIPLHCEDPQTRIHQLQWTCAVLEKKLLVSNLTCVELLKECQNANKTIAEMSRMYDEKLTEMRKDLIATNSILETLLPNSVSNPRK